MRTSYFILSSLLSLTVAAPSILSQTLPQNPTVAPKSTPSPHQWENHNGAYGYLYRGSLSCGGGIAYSEIQSKPTMGCGAGITVIPMVVTEFGFMAPALNNKDFTTYFSEDATVPIGMTKKSVDGRRNRPIVLVGYTRMFETGRNSFDYGTGFVRHIDEKHSLQFELRDYWTFASPQQHNVMLRVVWVTGIDD